MYHAANTRVTIPKNTQFCKSGANPSIALVDLNAITMDTANVMKNSIACQVQFGHDSLGM